MTDHNHHPDHRHDPIRGKETTMGQHKPDGRQPAENKPDSPEGPAEHGPSPRPALTPGQLLAAHLPAAQRSAAALSDDIRDAIAGLDPQAAAELGLAVRRSRRRLAWPRMRQPRKQTRGALGAALPGGDAGRLRDAQRAAASLIAGSIPPEAIARIEACAVERVPLPAGAALSDPDGPIPPSFDPDGRLLRSSDPDARPDRRSAAIPPGGLPTAHYALIAIACDRHDRRGDQDRTGPARAGCPPFALGVSVIPAGRPPGPAACDLIRRVVAASPQISEAAYDRGIAPPPGGFAGPLHALGVNLIADRPRNDPERAAPAPVPGRDSPRSVPPADADTHTSAHTARLALAEHAVRQILHGSADSEPALRKAAGTAARTTALAALAAAYNIRLARRWNTAAAETDR